MEESAGNRNRKKAKAVAFWLFGCCGLVFAMILIGAITRLTESGLSIVEWRPLTGALPPLNEEGWRRMFALYQTSPEFHQKHFWMDLEDFKQIFFWEWFHRLLGRLVGAAYALPFLFFLIKGWIPKDRILKLLGIFLLGGAQGFMGWFMVKSGLVDLPSVSHYRLAAHLSLALLIFVLMFWQGLVFLTPEGRNRAEPPRDAALLCHGWIALAFVFVTMLWGALTAGLDAGLVYNDTFPWMGETWIPEEVWARNPVWLSFFENHAGVQFVHRWLALATLVAVAGFAGHALAKKRAGRLYLAILVVVIVQAGLGIWTLFSHVALSVAVMHQGGAVVLLSLIVAALYALRPFQKNQRESCPDFSSGSKKPGAAAS